MKDTGIISPPKTMMEVFESLPEGTLVQLIENNIVMSPSPLDRHQALAGEIYSDLFQFVKKNDLALYASHHTMFTSTKRMPFSRIFAL
jgi:hypothetical protein